jgi:hypothetical protein
MDSIIVLAESLPACHVSIYNNTAYLSRIHYHSAIASADGRLGAFAINAIINACIYMHDISYHINMLRFMPALDS